MFGSMHLSGWPPKDTYGIQPKVSASVSNQGASAVDLFLSLMYRHPEGKSIESRT